MSKSLQDQLLSLGLAKKKADKRRSSKSSKRTHRRPEKTASEASARQEKRSVHGVEGDGGEEMALARAYALRQREEKRQAEDKRKRKQEEDRRRRQLNTAIRAIVKDHRLNDAKAEVPRNFMYKGRIRKINLTPDQLKSLNKGELGIVYMAGGYHLLVPEHVELVRTLSAEHVPDLGGTSDDDEEHPVPDDLTW